jgi:hypothetical protein
LPFDFSDFFCFAENICLVDGKQPIAVPIIAKDQELVHFNRLRCHLFLRLHLQPCHRQCHLTSADSPHIQHEATILHELHSMTPAAFRAELRASLTSFYEDILKVPGAGRRPQAKIITEALPPSLLQPNPHRRRGRRRRGSRRGRRRCLRGRGRRRGRQR